MLDGDPVPPLPNGHRPPFFGPYLLRPNGCMDQDVTWYGARPRVRWDLVAPSERGGGGPPKFLAHVYCDQTAGWKKLILGMVVSLSPGEVVLDGDPAPSPKRGRASSPILRLKVENFEIGPEVGGTSGYS